MIDLIMLICASIGAMAFGILAAYWILRAGFFIIQPRRSAPVKVHPETASIS